MFPGSFRGGEAMERLTMYQTGIAITMACSLKCKLCGNYAPYCINPENHSLDYLREMMRRYFAIVYHVRKLMFTGGEPLLHAGLAPLMKDIYQYRDRIDVLGIITNGTIVPGQELLEAAGQFGDKFHFLIDNYGPELSTKVPQIVALLDARGIRYILRNYTTDDSHCGGWVDFGDLSRKKCATQKEAEELFSKCAYPQKLHFCFDMVDGIMYPCGPSYRCKDLGIADDYSEYINLFDDALTLEEQREKIRAIYQKKSLTACAYCNGLCDDSQRFRPAQQLTREELARVREGARFYADI